MTNSWVAADDERLSQENELPALGDTAAIQTIDINSRGQSARVEAKVVTSGRHHLIRECADGAASEIEDIQKDMALARQIKRDCGARVEGIRVIGKAKG